MSLSKTFEMVVKALPIDDEELLKALGLEGHMVVDGPFSSHSPDFEGETITKAAILHGAQMHAKMGRHVDWEHQYRATLNPAFLIGQGVHQHQDTSGTPRLTTKLYGENEIAKSAWRLLKAGGELGYSVEGKATKRSPSNRKQIDQMDIYRVTLSPNPLGFDSRVRPVEATLKALCEGDSCEAAGWIDTNRLDDVVEELTLLNGQMPPIRIVEKLILKSYTTGANLVSIGPSSDASPLRPQSLIHPIKVAHDDAHPVDKDGDPDEHIVQPEIPKGRRPKTAKTMADALILKGLPREFVTGMISFGYGEEQIWDTWTSVQKGYH